MRVPRRTIVSSLNSSLHSSKPSGRLPALSRLLQHGLQRRSRGLVSQLHVFSGEPDFVAASAGFTSRFETKLVLLDPPLAGTLVTHGRDRKFSVSLEDLAQCASSVSSIPGNFSCICPPVSFRNFS